MTTNNTKTQKINFHQKHKGVSPILATVILLGVTVVGGGVTFALLSSGAQTASSQNLIAVENAQAVKGTDHADITATIKNAGSKPWNKIEMTVAKSELSEPLLYESLHEVAAGCKDVSSDTCKSGEASESGAAGDRDNPLRVQWIASLDKEGVNYQTNKADPGEGIGVGRKFVFESSDSYRTVQILNGTAIAPLFGGQGPGGPTDTTISQAMQDAGITTNCTPTGTGTFGTDCADIFKALDPSFKGSAWCRDGPTVQTVIQSECKVFTHQSIEDDPIGPGKSRYFYADAFTKEVPGLNNQMVRAGDALVINLVAEDADGGTARTQTIIKVTGL